MNYRYSKLLAEKTLSSDGVETIDLDIKDIISRLDISYRYTAAVSAMSDHGAACVTKIELVDGSDVLHSMTGKQNQALCIYDRGVPSMCHGQHATTLTEWNTFGIDFGLALWDEDLAFDPTKFSNPQLKITNDLDAANAGVATGYLEVLGHMFDEKAVSPSGFLMSKEHYSYTPGADNSYEYVELPQDYAIRRMLVQPLYKGYEPWAVIKEMRLDEDNEKRIPFDVEVEDHTRRMKGVYPDVEEMFVIHLDGTAEQVYYITPTDYYAMATFTPLGNSTLYHNSIPKGGKVTVRGTAATQVRGIARGILPHHCVDFPMGRLNERADWYDPKKYGKVRLRLKAGASGSSGTGSVILEQYRPYS